MITSETSSGFTPARCRTSLITTEQSSYTGTVDRVPLKDPVGEKREEEKIKLLIIKENNAWFLVIYKEMYSTVTSSRVNLL